MTIDSILNSVQTASGQVLLLLALPVVASIGCFLCGKSDGGRLARRVAVWMSLIHLALAAMLTASLYSTLDQDRSGLGRARFVPIAVPGEFDLSSRELPGSTSWSLVSFGPMRDPKSTARVPPSDIQFYVGIDGINLWLVPLTSLLTFLAVLLTWNNGRENPGQFLGWLFVMQLGSLGAFLSFDIVLFFVFFELTLVPALFLIGRFGVGGAKREAARTFFLYTLLGGAFTFFGILATVALNPTPLKPGGSEFLFTEDGMGSPKPEAGPLTFSIPQLMHNSRVWDYFAARERAQAKIQRDTAQQTLNDAKTPGERTVLEFQLVEATELLRLAERRDTFQVWIFFGLMAGFAVKLPIVPFHGWLPAAYSEAPAGITMYLSAILAKLGAFGIIRIVLALCSRAASEYGMTVFGTLAAIGIVYAALCAFAQTDIKKLAAYSSVSHLGLIVLGAFTLNEVGMGGASFHIVAHGLSAGLMFGLLAFLADRFGTLDSNRFRGLMGVYPRFTFFFMVAVLAGVGLPGLCNFVGEMAVISSLFDPKWTARGYGAAIAACSGVFLSAWYSFTLVRKVFFGPVLLPDQADSMLPKPADLNGREFVAFGLLSLGCLLLGILPQFVIGPAKPEFQMLSQIVVFTQELNDADRVNADRIQWEKWKQQGGRIQLPDEFRNNNGQPPAGAGGPAGGPVGRPAPGPAGGPAGGPVKKN